MNTSEMEKAVELLQPLFDKLAELGTHGWEVAVRQQVIEGFSSLAVWLGIIVVASLVIRWAMRRVKQSDPNGKEGAILGWVDETNPYSDTLRFHTVPFGVAWLALIVCVGLLLLGAPSILGKILNPEWAALQALLGLF
jgi:hypothetical protein